MNNLLILQITSEINFNLLSKLPRGKQNERNALS
jgi:hypothetical protein